jgi:hypothetical protein
MTRQTNSATKYQGPVSRIARRSRLFPRPHRQKATPPPPAGPVFRRVWEEVAPGQWQWVHCYDEADQN